MGREFPMKTAVRFLWRDSDEALHIGVGISHNISRTGVRIQAQHIPSLGARVQVIVDMPPATANTRPRRLMGHGIVVQVQQEYRQPAALAGNVCVHAKWAYRPAPIENAEPWRESAKIPPTSEQEPLVRSRDLELREAHFL